MLGMTSVTSVTQSENQKLQKSGATNVTEQKRFDYWVEFQKYAFREGPNPDFAKNFKERKPSVDQWMDFSIGFRTCHITISQIIKRDELDVRANMSFDWRELPERKASRIIIVKQNAKLDDRNKWKEQFDWLMNAMLTMKKVFTEVLKTIE